MPCVILPPPDEMREFFIAGEFIYAGIHLVLRAPAELEASETPDTCWEVVAKGGYNRTPGVKGVSLSAARANFELLCQEAIGYMSYSEVSRLCDRVVRAEVV